MKTPTTTISLPLLAFLTLPLAAPAAEWYLEPSFRTSVRHDDNVQMRTRDEQSATELVLEPRARFGRRTARSELQGEADFKVRRYSVDGLDTNDAHVGIDSHYLTSERSRLALDLDLTRDTTLESELDATGVVYARTDRESRSLAPGWSYVFDEKTRLGLDLGLTQVDYADEATTGLRDYETRSANGSVVRQWTEKTSLTLGLGWSRYERDDKAVRSDNRQLTLGAEHRFTERSRLSGYVGVRRTETELRSGATVCPAGTVFDSLGFFFFGLPPCVDTATGARSNLITTTLSSTTDSSGSVFGLTATRELETGEVSLNASRSIVPQGTGDGLIIADRLTLSASHSFSETLSGRLSLEWYRSRNTDDAAGSTDRSHVRFSPSLRWQPRRDWSFVASYRYMKQDREATLGTATGNVVSLAVNYAWPRLTRSR